MEIEHLQLGARYLGNGKCAFKVWAPRAKQVHIKLLTEQEQLVLLEKDEFGYHSADVENVEPGTRYLYVLDWDKERPDPASRYQPEGVHGSSEIVDANSFQWTDQNWTSFPFNQYILYELHVGTFTKEGTFDAVIPYLDELYQLGVNAIELLPVSQFPGERNWGYDGVYPFAAQNSYGGPEGLKRLVNACHERGLAIVLDVVYNHMGPEGNYLWDYGYYFTKFYKTSWGEAINFDGAHSDEVRRYFYENALCWLFEYHFDALRLDAIHSIYDFSAKPFLQEFSEVVENYSRKNGTPKYLIAESDLNNSLVIQPRSQNGYGMDAQWTDDFHHSLHSLLTGEREGYYISFGQVSHLAKSFEEGYVYSGQYSPFRKRRYGNSSKERPAEQFVVYAQDHDQVGNRMFGDRLSSTLSLESLKLAAGTYLLSPFVPMLFMGEEYGETAPFPYFVSHTDEHLIEGVRKGRKREFATFSWKGEPPDPFALETFESAYLDHEKKNQGEHKTLYLLYQKLIQMRKTMPALQELSKENQTVRYNDEQAWLCIHRGNMPNDVFIVFSFAKEKQTLDIPVPEGNWKKIMDSADQEWAGSGGAAPNELIASKQKSLVMDPQSFTVYERPSK